MGAAKKEQGESGWEVPALVYFAHMGWIGVGVIMGWWRCGHVVVCFLGLGLLLELIICSLYFVSLKRGFLETLASPFGPTRTRLGAVPRGLPRPLAGRRALLLAQMQDAIGWFGLSLMQACRHAMVRGPCAPRFTATYNSRTRFISTTLSFPISYSVSCFPFLAKLIEHLTERHFQTHTTSTFDKPPGLS